MPLNQVFFSAAAPSTPAKLPPLKLLEAKDAGFSKELQESQGMDPDALVERFNASYRDKFDARAAEVNRQIEVFEALEQAETLFGGLQETLQSLASVDVWNGFSAELPEGAQPYLELQSTGPACQFLLQIERLADENPPLNTKPFQAKSAASPLDWEGTIQIQRKDNPLEVAIRKEMSLQDIVQQLNDGLSVSGTPFQLMLMTVEEPQDNQDGRYQLLVSSLTDDPAARLEIKSVAEFDLLNALGVFSREADVATTALIRLNGTALERSRNTIDNILPGLKLRLKKVTPDPLEIKVVPSLEKAAVLIKDLVAKLSACQKLLNDDTPKAGEILGVYGRCSFLQDFLSEITLKLLSLADAKTGTFYGVQKTPFGFSWNEKIFHQEASSKFMDLSRVFSAPFKEGHERIGHMKPFGAQLFQVASALQKEKSRITERVQREHETITNWQQKIEVKRKKTHADGRRLTAAHQEGERMKKMNEQFAKALWGDKK